MSEQSSSQMSTNPNIQLHLENLSRTYRSRMRRHRSSATYQRSREVPTSRDVTTAKPEGRRTRLMSMSSSLNERRAILTLPPPDDGFEIATPSSPGRNVDHVVSPRVGANEWSVLDDEIDDVLNYETRPSLKATVKVRRVSAHASQAPALTSAKSTAQAQAEPEGSAYRNPRTKPYIKFRRAARAIMLIQRVCRVCKDLVYAAVCSEEWYTRIETFAGHGGTGLGDHSKRVRPFITLVPNQNKQLVQLTFDRSEFFKERRVDLTDEMRSYLNLKNTERTPEQTIEVLRFLKRASPAFNSYTLDTQRRMVQSMWFDTYQKDRVITAQGSQADGIFFVLSGKLVEKAKDRKQLREIKQGEGFGEEDIKCACPRRTTVVTQTTVDLITIHRQDYRAIFNMSVDSNDPKYLEICKQDLVFQHFPLHRLIDNPGVWTVLSYKFGCLMVKDSNEMEWIYIIKSKDCSPCTDLKYPAKTDLYAAYKKCKSTSIYNFPHCVSTGEARVIKHLSVADFNVRKRRREIEERQNLQSATYRNRQIIEFIDSKDAQKSRYNKDTYIPPRPSNKATASAPSGLTLAQQRRRRLGYMSNIGGGRGGNSECDCPNLTSNYNQKDYDSPHQTFHRSKSNGLRNESPRSERTRPHTSLHVRKPARARASMATRPCTGIQKPVVEIRIQDFDQEKEVTSSWTDNDSSERQNSGINSLSSSPRSDISSHTSSMLDPSLEPTSRGRYLGTSSGNTSRDDMSDLCLRLPAVSTSNIAKSSQSSSRGSKANLMVKVPPFVQLEALIPGKVFGLRSCLKPEERGPSASLVSGGCEVLQINKKFFLKHADEAILSLIKLKYKAFPSEEELVDRLDVNIRWEEYKQSTVLDFLRQRGKQASGYNTAFVSVT